MATRRLDHFAQGMGLEPEPPKYACSVCGYSSDNRRNFRRSEEGHVCSTGHYTNKEGEQKRQLNPYARR